MNVTEKESLTLGSLTQNELIKIANRVCPVNGGQLAKINTEATLKKEDTVSLQIRVKVLLSCTH